MKTNQDNIVADRVERMFKEGRGQEAVELCRQICEAEGARLEDWLLYGCVSADMGNKQTAMAALTKAVELDPNCVEAQIGLGKLLATSGDYAAAIDRLRKAAQLQPNNADVWLSLGIALGLAKQALEAEVCCRRCLELQPDSASGRFNLANALQAQGKLKEAVTEYEAALAIEPQMPMGWSMLSQTQVVLGKLAEAETAALRALSLQPRLGEAHFTLGNILAARGELERAHEHFRQATELLPGFSAAPMRLGQILYQLGDHAAAAEVLQKVIDADPKLVQAHFLLGEVLNEQKFYGKAALSYRNALALNNDHIQAHYRLAFLLLTVGQNAKAAEHFEQILRINPEDKQARHMLAAQKGEVTAAAPAEYVVNLFDEVADKFDQKLVGTLNYHIPERLHELVNQLASPAESSMDVIDLGCGTGLCAPLFRGMARILHGVDLAPRMIEKARERNLYDSLEIGDIVASLRSRKAAWDLAIAADVFVYIGDLGEIFTSCYSALRPGGLFIFSVEAAADDDAFVLRQTGRYAHSGNYIRKLATDTGLIEVVQRAAWVRREKGRDVPGYIYMLRRPVVWPRHNYQVKYFFD